MAQTLNEIKEEMRSGMEEAAREATRLHQQAEAPHALNIQKLSKIIDEIKLLKRHIEKALEFVDARLPDPIRHQIPRWERPKEIKVLELQQKIYKVLKKTEKDCENLNVDEANEQNKKEVIKKMQEIQDDMWDVYYMKIACLAALRSKDPSTPVGACIVDGRKEQIVGIGYNSMPYVKDRNNDALFPWKGHDGVPQEAEHNYKSNYIVHAAVNAITNKTKESIEGCIMYVTYAPDIDCAHAIKLAEIKQVFHSNFRRGNPHENLEGAAAILEGTCKLIPLNIENDGLSERIEAARRAHDGEKRPNGPSEEALPWETFCMELAELSKERPGNDSDPSQIVGACIVSQHKQIMTIGYSRRLDDIHIPGGDDERDYIHHAEYKAIIGGPSVRGCTLYVTKYPCEMCAKVVVQAGIAKVVYDKEGGRMDEKYISSRLTLRTCLGAENIINIRHYWK